MEIEIIGTDTSINEKLDKIRLYFELSHNDLLQLFDIKRCDYDGEFSNVNENSDLEIVRISRETEAFLHLFHINDDERLRGYINELQMRYNIDIKLLSKILKKKEEIIEGILNNSNFISIEDRYSIGMKVVYLLFLFSART